MEFDKYLINLSNLFLNKENYVLNLIEKLVYQLESDRGYLTDTCYSYFDIKHFNKKEFSDIFQFINIFNIMNNNNNSNRDLRTVLKFKDNFLLFESLYVPTMDCNIYIYNSEFDLGNIEYDFIISFNEILNFYNLNIPEEINKDYYFKNLCY